MDALSILHKSLGWDLLASDGEEKIAQLFNQVLAPQSTLEGLIKRESLIGEIRGMKAYFGMLEAGIDNAEYDVQRLTPNEEEEDANKD